MEIILDIGEDVSFIFNSDAIGSGQNNQPEFATFFTYNAEPIIGYAELSDLDQTLGKGDEYDYGKT